VEIIEGWRKLQNDGFYILPVNNILRVIKSKENSTFGMYSISGRNVKISKYGWLEPLKFRKREK
jgi:hypothetical protein